MQEVDRRDDLGFGQQVYEGASIRILTMIGGHQHA